jgi:hypothetical protein
MNTSSPAWPELSLTGWEDTRDTVHMWTQIVGKIQLALNPMINHWWGITQRLSARGLTTGLMHTAERGVEIEFDCVDHELLLRTTDGGLRTVALEPRTVADFYAATMRALDDLGISVRINPRPTEVEISIPFLDDDTHRSYDPDAIHRFWLALVQMHKVFHQFQSRFIGKQSPIHFFWGAFDLASTRFSGRSAPKHRGGIPNCPDYVQVLAYSHEVHSCGYWPGGAEEGAFYAYAYPEPAGFAHWSVHPDGAAYEQTFGEFLLPYRIVRTAADPGTTLLTFLQSTYEAAATLADWDGAAPDTAHRADHL